MSESFLKNCSLCTRPGRKSFANVGANEGANVGAM